MSKSTTVNKNKFTPFANDGCQSLPQSTRISYAPFANDWCQNLPQSTRMGSHPLLMVDVKIYHSQQEWVHTLC